MKTTPTECIPELLATGATYVDVRTAEEFALGHVPGALNIPVSLGSLSGLTPNPDFEKVAGAVLASSSSLILGCHSGARAKRAATQLAALGFTHLLVDEQGWDGSRDPFGRFTPGWSKLERPKEQGQPKGRSYQQLADSLLQPVRSR